MPWTINDPPPPAQNWVRKSEVARCVRAANAVLERESWAEADEDERKKIEARAIYACIAAAGKSEQMAVELAALDEYAGPTLSQVHLPTGMEGRAPAKAEVDYRMAGEDGQACSTCRRYDDGRCSLLQARVAVDYVCARWQGGKTRSGALLVPVAKGLDSVLVFPFGMYHRAGQKRQFTRADGEAMVANFDGNVLERRHGFLPVNLEHERTKGRVAFLTRLWVAEDGVRGKLEALDGDAGEVARFDYLSPEVSWRWRHPYTGDEHRNVLMGAALTNYPFLLGRTALHAEGALVWTEKGWRDLGEAFVHDVPFSLADAERRVAYGVVLQPDVPDAQGHVMSADEIEAACHRFMQTSQALDEHHERLLDADEAKVVESWIQREPVIWEWSGRRTEIIPGTWCMAVKFLDDKLWREVQSGEVAGFSPKGWGMLKPAAS